MELKKILTSCLSIGILTANSIMLNSCDKDETICIEPTSQFCFNNQLDVDLSINYDSPIPIDTINGKSLIIPSKYTIGPLKCLTIKPSSLTYGDSIIVLKEYNIPIDSTQKLSEKSIIIYYTMNNSLLNSIKNAMDAKGIKPQKVE